MKKPTPETVKFLSDLEMIAVSRPATMLGELFCLAYEYGRCEGRLEASHNISAALTEAFDKPSRGVPTRG